ncbi:hypothetical protein [Hoeflea sp.]|uniref:hypothetical protein n=1 Tax=Hoeflea sp. TaxID=1940281 RepID=UPI003747FF10
MIGIASLASADEYTSKEHSVAMQICLAGDLMRLIIPMPFHLKQSEPGFRLS